MSALIERLQSVMREVFLDDGLVVSRQTTAYDVDGWDSLSHSMLMLEIEQAFGITVEPGLAARLANVGELVDHLQARGA